MNDWISNSLAEIAIFIKDGTHGTFKDVYEGIPLLSAKDIIRGKVAIPNNCRQISRIDYDSIHTSYELEENDLLLTIVGTIGRSAIIKKTDKKFTFQRSVGIVRLNISIMNPLFGYYIFNSDDFMAALERSKNASAQGGVYLGELEKIKIKYPSSLETQRRIAKILSAIDVVIEKTDKAISKYKSIKQGMLQDLFTRGIDQKTGKLRPKPENAPQLYKESKSGLIPKEWDDPDILSTTYLKGRIGWQGLRADEFIEEGPYLITGTDFINGNINWSTCYHITEKRFLEAPLIHIQNGDVLITKDGTIGKLAYVEGCPDKAILNSGIFVMRPLNEIYYGKYFFYMLNSEVFQKWLRVYKGGSTILHLYQREFEKFNFPLPELKEQEQIIEKLDSIENKINTEQLLLKKYVELKQGLMADLLTGKVEVNTKIHN